MVTFWQKIVTIFLLYIVVINGNRARRYRRQSLNKPLNPVNEKLIPPNPDRFNVQEPTLVEKHSKKSTFTDKPTARQFYPYRFQYGYGTVQGISSPYAGSGVGLYQYGYGEYGQYGQGSQQYAAYYNNRIPGTLNFYPGFNSIGSYDANNFPPAGTNYPGNYFWSDGQTLTMNRMNIVLSLWFSLIIYLHI